MRGTKSWYATWGSRPWGRGQSIVLRSHRAPSISHRCRYDSRKSFGILANEEPRPEMPERGDRFSMDLSGHERSRWVIEVVAKG